MIEINLLTPQHRYGDASFNHKTILTFPKEIYLSGLVKGQPHFVIHVRTTFGHDGYYNLRKVHTVVWERDN